MTTSSTRSDARWTGNRKERSRAMATMEEYAKQPLDQRLKRLERTAGELAATIEGRSGVVLTKRPGEKNWAGVEIICHLRDAEETFDGRLQMYLAMEEV